MEPLHFRFALPSDAGFLAETHNAYISGGLVTAQTEPFSEENRLEWLQKHEPDRRPCWIAELDGERVGMVSVSDFHPRCAYSISAEISVYLHPAFIHQGLGAKVLFFAESQAPKLGIENLIALIYNTNTGSLRLFERMGYVQVGHLPRVAHHADGYRDLIYMQKGLVQK